MSDSFSSLTIKKSFEHKTLCECKHRILDHRMLDMYVQDYDTDPFDPNFTHVLCFCGCQYFKLASNLIYLEMMQKEKSSEAGTYP